MKKLITITAALLGFTTFGQIHEYTNFWNNLSANNPAWMVQEGRVNVSSIASSNANLKVSVANQTITSFQLPKRFGFIGLSNDVSYSGYNFFVATLNHSSKLRYANVFDLNNESTLSLGAEVGLLGRSTRQVGDWENNCSTCDPMVFIPTKFIQPTYTFGAVYRLKDLSVGASINQFPIRAVLNNVSSIERLYRIESQVSYAFNFSENWTFRPMVRYLAISNFQSIDGLIKAEFKDQFWASAYYGSSNLSGLSAGAQLGKNWSVGYGFNFYLSRLNASVYRNSHEIMLRYRLN